MTTFKGMFQEVYQSSEALRFQFVSEVTQFIWIPVNVS